MHTRDAVSGNSPIPQVFRCGNVNTENIFYCNAFIKYFSKICANLKSHNRVYALLSRHTYRPIRAHIVSQLFYKYQFIIVVKSCNPLVTSSTMSNLCCKKDRDFDIQVKTLPVILIKLYLLQACYLLNSYQAMK